MLREGGKRACRTRTEPGTGRARQGHRNGAESLPAFTSLSFISLPAPGSEEDTGSERRNRLRISGRPSGSLTRMSPPLSATPVFLQPLVSGLKGSRIISTHQSLADRTLREAEDGRGTSRHAIDRQIWSKLVSEARSEGRHDCAPAVQGMASTLGRSRNIRTYPKNSTVAPCRSRKHFGFDNVSGCWRRCGAQAPHMGGEKERIGITVEPAQPSWSSAGEPVDGYQPLSSIPTAPRHLLRPRSTETQRRRP